jgi:hypothetical protein
MTQRLIHLITAGATFTILIVGLISIGIFSRDRIIVTTLATTGPHFKVVLGSLKLKFEMPDSIEKDISGVIVTAQSIQDLNNYLQGHYQAFGDYFILTEKVVGVQQSDNPSFHPLIEINHWQHIDRSVFWFLLILAVALFVVFIRSTTKYLKLRKRLDEL